MLVTISRPSDQLFAKRLDRRGDHDSMHNLPSDGQQYLAIIKTITADGKREPASRISHELTAPSEPVRVVKHALLVHEQTVPNRIGKLKHFNQQLPHDMKQRPQLFLRCKDASREAMLASCAREIITLTKCASMEILSEDQVVPDGCVSDVIDSLTTIYLLFSGDVLDANKELEKAENREAEITCNITKLQRKMGMPGYKQLTPGGIQTLDLGRLQQAEAELESIHHHINQIKSKNYSRT